MKFPIWFSAVLITASVATATSKPQNALHGLSPAEKWVVAQVKAGEIADLLKQFPGKEEDQRKLSAHFLEELLMGAMPGFKLHRNGVQIVGATIDEPIYLTNAQIRCEVDLEHCQFLSSATFERVSFAGKVSFEGSTFKADAVFSSMKIGGDAFFTDAVFEGPVNFVLADIAGSFAVGKAKFQNKEKGASFNSMKVGGTVALFNDAVFEGPASFVLADITGSFAAGKVKFQNKEKAASFSSMKVGGAAFFNGAIFEGSVNFVLADIASAFAANDAKFQNKEREASFNSMKVGGAAFFKNAVFEGPVNFGSGDIAGNLEANEAKFQNKEREASFDSMKVGGAAIFNDVVCEGPVNFTAAGITSNFVAQRAKFQNKEKDANFGGMKVGGYAFFNDAVFEGPVNFVWTDVASSFAVGKAKFRNKGKGASFAGMKVRGYAFFNGAVFEGAITFGYADFAWLDLSNIVWPKVADQFHMQGMSYKYIRAAPEEPESHKALLKLADHSAYTADVYSNLEEFFLRQGYRDDSDRAFIAGKRRERKENLHGLGLLGSWLLDGLVGYGRRPWQAGVPCAVLVALGCLLFSPKKMEPQRPDDTPRVYSRFWYSLGLFLPFVDLQADKVWKPKADETFLRNYMRVHVLLGWILIPIVLAALTGLIK